MLLFKHLLLTKGPCLIMGTLCAQLLLPFYADSFKTPQVLLSWGQFLFNPQINVCHFFQDLNLGIECYQCLYNGCMLCN